MVSISREKKKGTVCNEERFKYLAALFGKKNKMATSLLKLSLLDPEVYFYHTVM